ncbi:hypothetical protein ACM55O_07320 [Hafnia paralvei]|uniref:hypothetical protein n=1 Tax=Hafnia paralvei TaxID=546367 RepID=UPI0039FDA65F
MTKLTTERLETIATWREKYGNSANVMIPAEEAELMARQILAYEQAANEVACWGVTGQRGQIYPLSPQTARMDSFPLYRAPVLPKQPEHSRQHFESLCNQFWNWAEFDEINQDEEPRLEWNGSDYTHRVTAALWKMYQAAPAQPVIPEQCEVSKKRLEVIGYGSVPASIDEQRSMARTLLSAQPVSEPYKLISVKDDTPTESGDYWCYLGKDFESPTKYRVVHFDVRHHEFQDHRVTHWMRLPAEPEREA